jgi:hypothetical protein
MSTSVARSSAELSAYEKSALEIYARVCERREENMGSLSSARRGDVWDGDVGFGLESRSDGGGDGEAGMDEGGVGKMPAWGVESAMGGESLYSCIEEVGMDGRSKGIWGRAPPCASTWAVVSGVGGRRELRKLSGRVRK